MKKEIVVVGDKNQVLLFRAIGADSLSPKKENIHKVFLKAIEEYKIIYIFSSFAKLVQNEIKENAQNEYPIITILPENAQDKYPQTILENQVESAFGTGAIFKEKK